MTACPASRRGMTLVELLVVTGLIISLLGIAVAGLRPGGTAAGQVRRSAQTLASAFVAAQSRALGNPEGAGVIIEPDVVADPSGRSATVVDEALMHPAIVGDVTDGLPPSNLASTSATIQFTPRNASASDLIHGHRILVLGGETPTMPPTAWMAFTNPTAAGGTVRFRAGAGQTSANTIWPKKPAAGGLTATIARYPAKAGAATGTEKLAAIDLRHSGVGDDPTTPYGRLDGRGAIAVTFDRTGGLAEVMQQVLASVARSVDPVIPRQPVYFLVAERADIADAGVNVLSKQDVVWVTVFPPTGRVSVSSNVPQSGTDAAALFAARANARLAIPVGK